MIGANLATGLLVKLLDLQPVKKKILIILFLFGLNVLSYGQAVNSHFGLYAAWGSHFQRLGFYWQEAMVMNHLQINPSFATYYNFKSIGPSGRYWEARVCCGLVYGFGKTSSYVNSIIDPVSNQTSYSKSIGYGYYFWLNDIGTSQVTGSVAFQYNHIKLILDDDILAAPATDRFRTGGLAVQYQDSSRQFGIENINWTGAAGPPIRGTAYPSRQGYRDMRNVFGGNCSNGIAEVYLVQLLKYNQSIKICAGVDAEQVRHWVQNKVAHDVYFLPKQFSNKHNPHFPMLQPDGSMYLFRPNEKIRKPKPVYSFFLNQFGAY